MVGLSEMPEPGRASGWTFEVVANKVILATLLIGLMAITVARFQSRGTVEIGPRVAAGPTSGVDDGRSSLKPDGEPCVSTSDCRGGNCRWSICCAAGKTCCSSDAHCSGAQRCGPEHYCTDEGEVAYTGESCDLPPQPSPTLNPTSTPAVKLYAVDRIHVRHFHGHQQCTGCRNIAKFSEYTLRTYFAEELENGIITYESINVEIPENADIAKKYGVTSSSLFLNVVKDGEEHIEENTRAWYVNNEQEQFVDYFRPLLKAKLGGLG